MNLKFELLPRKLWFQLKFGICFNNNRSKPFHCCENDRNRYERNKVLKKSLKRGVEN